ncbi:MAG: rRNA maturation RNase YbeY [Clostridia bacterium]|nr:rRNA maturation RNase YbeY [Clostridia bacterium]
MIQTKDDNNLHLNIDDEIYNFLSSKLNSDADIENSIKAKIMIIADTLIEYEKIVTEKIYISIETASKEEIKNLNREYREMDKVTDVLSFPIFSRNELEELRLDDKKSRKHLNELDLGDIILCLDVIYEQSINYETGIVRELLYMITHGICHLVGYDHENEEDKNIMRKVEESVLSKVGVVLENVN